MINSRCISFLLAVHFNDVFELYTMQQTGDCSAFDGFNVISRNQGTCLMMKMILSANHQQLV